jgi:hypothetical protein
VRLAAAARTARETRLRPRPTRSRAP